MQTARIDENTDNSEVISMIRQGLEVELIGHHRVTLGDCVNVVLNHQLLDKPIITLDSNLMLILICQILGIPFTIVKSENDDDEGILDTELNQEAIKQLVGNPECFSKLRERLSTLEYDEDGNVKLVHVVLLNSSAYQCLRSIMNGRDFDPSYVNDLIEASMVPPCEGAIVTLLHLHHKGLINLLDYKDEAKSLTELTRLMRSGNMKSSRKIC
jgi:hypothetical protein